MFNPLEMALLARNIVCKNDHRKYYRFRPSRFYRGISTATVLRKISGLFIHTKTYLPSRYKVTVLGLAVYMKKKYEKCPSDISKKAKIR